MEQSSTHRTAISADGTPLAYEEFGTGTPLITVTGATAHRALMRPTAEAFGRHFRAVAYDRRGRFDSGDTLPYAVEREVEDLEALIAAVGGGPVHLYGHSSGAGLVLRAVAAGLPVARFVVYDPPYSPYDATAQEGSRDYDRALTELLARDDRAGALGEFFRRVGVPEQFIEQIKASPAMVGLAPTLAYDSAIMNDRAGGSVPADLARQASRPGLVLVGGGSPPFMHEVGQQLADLLPAGTFQVVPGQDHNVDPDAITPVVAEFLTDRTD